ncbi:iron-containing alcohol dehydrogenase [Dorea sp. D27]|uniref:iron-containing alcohol dehydrogenase n=1 Tax=Dorea sp. D27 TaxID=658665 RepID=UPI0006737F87|nr:iron-containing alcohol dehydrogenase [Dorea sp. D27]KMZ52915.1 NADH-dependent butanol dehydrogenase A [Dorea sp. D27]
MNNFEYYNPTKVVFGQGRFADLGAEVKSLGNIALLVKQEGPLEQMGVYERAVKILEEAQVTVQVLEYVSSNPKLSKIREGIALAKEEGVEVVVAVGGGSAIDAGKAIAIGTACGGDVWEFFRREKDVSASLPMIAVSTISATGAETSCHVVITNDEPEDTAKWQKWAIHDSHAFPETAIIDPELLVSVPKKITAAGMADTISHVLEGYFDGVPHNPLSDRIGEGIVMTVIENEKVLDNPEDLNARAALSWAATLAMSGLQDCGRSNAGFPAHWIQHAVGALTDSSHGEGLAVINPAWLELENEKSPVKFMQFAERVFGIERTEQMTDAEYGMAGIQALKAVFKRWGLPETLGELGVTSEMIPTIVRGVMESPETYVFEEGTVEQVLRRCL